MPTKSPEVSEVAAALRRVLRHGLPVTPTVADPILLALRGVIARAADPDDMASRASALDGVLRGLLARFGDSRHSRAARILFGLPPTEPGMKLTPRRTLAAREAGYEEHHFRKRVEPRVLEHLAAALLADADRFTRSQVIAPRLAPSPSRQTVPADPFAWEVAEHEEVLARLWSAIYALRAELIAVERLTSLSAERKQVIGHAVTAAWRWALASTEASAYAAAFGTADGDPVSTAHDLVSLAGWTPSLTTTHAERLRAAAAGGADRTAFVAALDDDAELGSAWVEAFYTPTTDDAKRRTVTSPATTLAEALAAAATGAPRRYVITGGPSSGKDDLIDTILASGIPCMETEPGREIYRKHRERLGRHLLREDRREYSLDVLQAFVAEFTAHKHGIRFYNRGIPDGYGWESFFGLRPAPELEEATRLYRYDTVFVLDPLDTFEDPDDIVWAKDREIRRVHELIVQGYYDAGYEPVFIAADSAAARLDFLCANLRLPKPSRKARQP